MSSRVARLDVPTTNGVVGPFAATLDLTVKAC